MIILKSHKLRLILSSLLLTSFFLISAEVTASTTTKITKFKLADYSWVSRNLKAEPTYASKKVKYAIWVLGNEKKSVMTIVWDESKGTGTGYDTLYVDKNFNGDLTEDGERISSIEIKTKRRKGTVYEIGTIKSGADTFYFKWHMTKENNIAWYSSMTANIKIKTNNITYKAGILPGNIKLNFSHNIKTAPVYRFGGEAIPVVLYKENRKKPTIKLYAGSNLGTWTAGTYNQIRMAVSLIGDNVNNEFRFFKARFPGGEPQISLKVFENGKVKEEILFTGGCGCGGTFAKGLFIPSRVPPGEHSVIIRMNRLEALGGVADFEYKIKIVNPTFGKPLVDPAYTSLKEKFPNAKIASLRRLSSQETSYKGFPEENVFAARISDTRLVGNGRDWNPSNANFGTEIFMRFGKFMWSNEPYRHLIKIDLSGINKETKILGAYLRFTLVRREGTTKKDSQLDFYALRRGWNENNTAVGGASWNGPLKIKGSKEGRWAKTPADDTKVDRYPEIVGSIIIGKFPKKDELNRLVTTDITNIVNKWHRGEIENNGLVHIFKGSGYADKVSSEFQDYIYRPTLVLAYEGNEPKNKYAIQPGEDFEAAKQNAKLIKKPILIKFYSPYCGVCKQVEKTTMQSKIIKKALANDFHYVHLKIQEHTELAKNLGVGSVPTVVILDNDGITKKGLIMSDILRDAGKFGKAIKELSK